MANEQNVYPGESHEYLYKQGHVNDFHQFSLNFRFLNKVIFPAKVVTIIINNCVIIVNILTMF